MRWMRATSAVVVWVGVLAGIWGVAYTVNGMTQAHASVRAPVTLIDHDLSGWGDITLEIPGVEPPDLDGGVWFVGARPGGWTTTVGSLVTGPDGELTIVAWGSTRAEQLLARGNFAVTGLGLLVGALAVAPVLRSISEGRPFAPGNSRRLVVVAATVAVAGSVAPVLPHLAGVLVLERVGLAGPRFAAATAPALTPLLVGLVVLAVAAAFRTGERMSDDVSGLV